ncbi:MAG: ATP-dependent DNA helicase RecG [Solirubrobacteraceae bacterium]
MPVTAADLPLRFASLEPLDARALLEAPVRLPRPSRLARPLAIRPPRAARAAETLGLRTVGDLLEHVPHRHEDRRDARAVASLAPGEDATVVVTVSRIALRRTRRRGLTLVEATVADDSGPMRAVWFNQPWVAERVAAGERVVLYGRYEGRNRFRVGDWQPAPAGAAGATLEREASSAGLVPVYPAAEGIASKRIRELAWAYREAVGDVVDPLPAALLAGERLAGRPAALAAVHFPRTPDDDSGGRRRLAFDELMLAQLTLLRRRALRERSAAAPALDAEPSLSARWLAELLPFAPTGDQERAIAALRDDLGGERPMQRLLMGEVGSGKTVVALWGLLRAVESGKQGALMAPTETLAEQHFATLQALLPGELVPLALLTGSTPAARRRDVLGKLAGGELSIVVGTHALIEPDVGFARLALAVVDEQHRFGVRQRAALDAKGPDGLRPHVLHMTATPIPRTLALTAYGDLDVTVLRELPAGRRPVATHVISGERERARAYERIREELRAGRQAFVVCPLVEQSEALAARAATAEFERLAATELRDFRVLLLHGQMRPPEKQDAMARFAAGEADALVATSVIEVGIDVPNATVMLVEDADRYGISQLHQLRGRVGRGEHESLCLLFGPADSRRLRALAEHRDGFRLAEIDLELRGEGELAGVRQSGLPAFRVARLPQDAELLDRARGWARRMLGEDPDLRRPDHALLGEALAGVYGEDATAPIPG